MDLASRNGPPDSESTCPYDGKGIEIANLAYTKQYDGDIVPWLKTQPDFDPAKKRAVDGPYIDKKERESMNFDYYRERLEDIDVSWVMSDLGNKIFAAMRNNENSIKAADRKYKEHNVVYYDPDEGKLVSESDLAVQYEENSELDTINWREQVPFILKRLFTRSKEIGISLISLIIAYEREKKFTPGNRNVSPTSVIKQGVYYVDGYGELTTKVLQNKGDKWVNAFKWVKGELSDSYYDDAIKLLNICSQLNIDIAFENPELYTREFHDSLVVTYITKNVDYLSGRAKRPNKEIIAMLKTIDVSDYYSSVQLVDRNPTFAEIEKYTKYLFNNCFDPNIYPRREEWNDEVRIKEFLDVYNKIEDKSITLQQLYAMDGFYYYRNGKSLYIHTKHIMNSGSPNAIIHSSGYLINIIGTDCINYIPISLATNYFKESVTNPNEKFKWEIARK